MHPLTAPRRDRRAIARKGLVALSASLLGIAAFAAPARAVGIGTHDPLANGTVDGFPNFYQDADGQKLAPCRPAGPLCGIAVPGSEDFYTIATADVGGTNIELAQEATTGATPSDINLFGRLRIRGTDLVAGQWYRFTYPYGQVDHQAVDPAPRVVNFTNDVGCGVLFAVLCTDDASFSIPSGSDIGPNFLQWDTSVSAPPNGFLGDGATPHAVVGSTFVPPGETTPANYFRIDRITGPGGSVISTVGQTDQFAIVGQLAPGAQPSGELVNSSADFGDHRTGGGATVKAVTLRNGGGGVVDLNGATLGGPDAAQFSLDNGCAGATTNLNAGASCVVNVTFTPTGAAGPRSASLSVIANGTPRTIPLLGRATLPVLSIGTTAVDFGNQAVGTTVGPRTITVSNTGTAAMAISSSALAGPGLADYTLGLNTCAGASVAPGTSCTVEVFFTPKTAGARAASVALATDVGPGSISLSGIGVQLPTAITAVLPGTNPGPGDGGAAVSKLSLTRLTTTSKVKRSRARSKGIRLVIGVPAGATVVRISIYRKSANGALKLLSDGFKSPAKAGLYRVNQSHLTLRRSFGTLGTYLVRVTPGASKTNLGNASQATFKVVRG